MKQQVERFFTVEIIREVRTLIRVAAIDSADAVERAHIRAPGIGQAWEVRRNRARILNVSSDGKALSEGGYP